MAKQTPNYFIVLLMFACAAAVTYWARSRPPRTVVEADLQSLPAAIGGWTRQDDDQMPDEEVLSGWNVSASDFLSRSYRNDEGIPVNLMIIFKGLDRRDWHPSEMCFAGSGYDVEQTYTTVPYAGKSAPAVKVVATETDTGVQTVAVYWFAAGDRTEASFAKQQWSTMIARYTPERYGWAFVRVDSPVIYSEEDTMRLIRGFVGDASGAIVQALTGGGPGGKSTP